MSQTSGSSIARETEPLRDRNLEAFEKYQPVIHARLLDHAPVSPLESAALGRPPHGPPNRPRHLDGAGPDMTATASP